MFLQRKVIIVYPQWIAGTGVLLLLIQLGLIEGWTSPTLAKLTAPDTPICLNTEETSWVASLVNIGRLIGAILGPITADRFGSKRCIFITLWPIAIGWLILTFANSIVWLYFGRLSSGIGLGMVFSSFPIFIGEVSIPKIRGALISLASCGYPFGIVIATVCSFYLSMCIAASIYLSMCVVLIALFFWLPESPHYLVRKENLEAAKSSINWYRSGKGVDEELEGVQKFTDANAKVKFVDKVREFGTPPVKKAIFNVMALYTFKQICGLNIVILYMEIILRKAHSTFIDPSQLAIYVNIFGVFAAVLSIFLIDKYGRKFLLFVSSSGTTLSMFGLMVHFILLDSNIDPSKFQWLPLCSMVLFTISYHIGLFPVPSTNLSESFPANIKCIAASIAVLTTSVMAFLSSKTYLPLVELIGDAYVFLVYAIFSVMVIPYTLFAIMETKGKSLQQIQDKLVKK